MPRHPIQPLVRIDGVIRFKKNAIVEYLLETSKKTMDDLAVIEFTQEDREQFAQLIGYSLSGFADLSYVSDKTYQEAESFLGMEEIEEVQG